MALNANVNAGLAFINREYMAKGGMNPFVPKYLELLRPVTIDWRGVGAGRMAADMKLEVRKERKLNPEWAEAMRIPQDILREELARARLDQRRMEIDAIYGNLKAMIIPDPEPVWKTKPRSAQDVSHLVKWAIETADKGNKAYAVTRALENAGFKRLGAGAFSSAYGNGEFAVKLCQNGSDNGEHWYAWCMQNKGLSPYIPAVHDLIVPEGGYNYIVIMPQYATYNSTPMQWIKKALIEASSVCASVVEYGPPRQHDSAAFNKFMDELKEAFPKSCTDYDVHHGNWLWCDKTGYPVLNDPYTRTSMRYLALPVLDKREPCEPPVANMKNAMLQIAAKRMAEPKHHAHLVDKWEAHKRRKVA